jgi:hypothetical protein
MTTLGTVGVALTALTLWVSGQRARTG